MFRRIGSSSNRCGGVVEVRVTCSPESTRKSMKKQFPNNFHVRSEIKDARLFALSEGVEISHSKLNVQDIEGATPNTNLSQALKNRMQRYHTTKKEQTNRNTLIREAVNQAGRALQYQHYSKEASPKIVTIGKQEMPLLNHTRSQRCRTLQTDNNSQEYPKMRRLLYKKRAKTQLYDQGPLIKYICVPQNLLRNRDPNQF